MTTINQTMPLRLTSQYARGVQRADSAALDAEGRDWYRFQGSPQSEDIEPNKPPCIACGLGVDWWHESHWYADYNLWAHDNPKCVKLMYPKTEKPVTGTEKLQSELHTLAERADKALDAAEAISEDFPCRDDLVGYVRRAAIALTDAEMTLIG